MTQRFEASDLVNGVVRVLADRGYASFYVRTDRLDAAFDAAYQTLLNQAPRYGLNVRFRIARDEFGESSVIRAALNGAAQRDVISFDNPEYQDMRLDRRKLAATVLIERLPGDKQLYDLLADSFLQEYERSAAQGPQVEVGAA